MVENRFLYLLEMDDEDLLKERAETESEIKSINEDLDDPDIRSIEASELENDLMNAKAKFEALEEVISSRGLGRGSR